MYDDFDKTDLKSCLPYYYKVESKQYLPHFFADLS